MSLRTEFITVEISQPSGRLDAFLVSKFPAISRGAIQRLITEGHILVDGQRVATQKLEYDKPGEFFDVDYPVPEALTQGKDSIKVRVVPHTGNTAGPVFGMRLFTAKPAVSA